jgi:N-acetylglucosamine malate deacetylase 1
MAPELPGCDLLCIAPHTDDAEIGIGGTLRLLADRGRRVWVCDLTRGELATNATPDERWAEAARASEVLGLAGRLQLTLPDGFVDAADPAQAAAVTAVIRALRPRWVVSAPEPVRHPDHVATPLLVQRSAFLAHLASYGAVLPAMRWWSAPGSGERAVTTPAGPWRPEAVFEVCPEHGQPSVIFDVSDTWAAKQAALACYASQFAGGPGRRPTHINDPAFQHRVEARGRLWGHRAGVAHAEALRTVAAAVLDDLPSGRWA